MGMEKMSRLYLSTSADQAASLPSRQAATRRWFVQVSSCGASGEKTGPGSSVEIEFLHTPQCVVVEDGGAEVPHTVLGRNQHVRSEQRNERDVIRHELLHAVVELLALREAQGGKLAVHQGVDLRFPRGRRLQ